MFRSLKKRATTVFKKKKGSNSQLQDIDSDSTLSFTRSTSDIRREDNVLVPAPPSPPPPPPSPPPPPPPPPTRLVPSTPTLQRVPTPVPAPASRFAAQDLEPRQPPDLLYFDDEPGPAQPVADEPDPDPFSPKYVPFIESSPLRNNMFAAQTSIYGRINPDIMGGFGDDSDSIWLVDDEETDEEEEERRRQRQQDEPTLPDTDANTVMREVTPEPPAVLETQSTGNAAGPAFNYRTPALLDDDEWLPNPTSTPDTTPPERSPSPRRGYAPISTSILDLTNIDSDEQSPPTKASLTSPRDAVTPTSASSSTNPYVALLEQQDNAMTVAYLRRLEQSGDVLTDDFSFGQRYQKAADTPDVIVTHQRVPAVTVIGEMECVVCTETKPVSQFPRFSITAACVHPPNTCLECIQMSVESDLNNKLWTQIRCPECRELLEYADIQRYANEQTFLRYETLAIRAAMSEAENFFWCTSGCGSGQIHESGDEQPIVICLHCNHRSCFQHNVAWHETLTCVEYDELLKDPENFRSRVERENEEWTEAQQAQLEADQAMAQGLLAEEQAELKRREERARQEREQARKAAELVRKIAARRKREEAKSEATVSRTTKPCPGCGWAIEKNDGCSHMTCAKCKHQFCYECGADHKRIMKGDNSAHGKNCKFHPSNMEEDGP